MTDYVDDLALHTNAPALGESLQHNLEQPKRGIGCYVNANKTEYTYSKQKKSSSL